VLLAGSGPDPRCFGPVQADLACAVFFLRKCSVKLFVLQNLKFHRICSLHANELIQISLGSLDEYLSDGIALIFLEAA
jgi:hypothetical protein